jgi:hypothetical protein
MWWRGTNVSEEPATSISGQKLEAAGAPETCANFLPNNPSERQEHLKLDIQRCEKSKF